MTERTEQFEALALPHLDAAYNLARWLLRDDHNAQDVVQDAYLRAFRFFDGFEGRNARPWLLRIVRTTCYTWLKNKGRMGEQIEFDEERDSDATLGTLKRAEDNPEILLLQKLERARIDKAIAELPPVFREVVVLRELEEMSYDEIAQVAAIPIGTVMSRLARARALLRATLSQAGYEGKYGTR